MARILIAEDSRTQAVHFQAALRKAGYDVSVVEDGAQALTAVGQVHPDIVVTDMQMPAMNGLELVDHMRFQYPNIPVVLITAHGSEELSAEALRRGAAAYVPKSQASERLTETIEQVVSLVRAERVYAGLLGCLARNEFAFDLTNDPALIGPLGDLIQQMLRAMNLGDAIERLRIGIALEHALLNALYHGNLGLSAGATAAEIEQRQAQPPYADRRIYFNVHLTRDEARFVVRDEGAGFDTSIVPEPGDPNALEREGGRGLLLMRSFMDEVQFNEQGNEVTLIKRCAPAAAP